MRKLCWSSLSFMKISPNPLKNSPSPIKKEKRLKSVVCADIVEFRVTVTPSHPVTVVNWRAVE